MSAPVGAAGPRPHAGADHAPRLAWLVLGALGVVYGDIGTSPLYAVKECFSGGYGIAPTHENVLGVLSLVFWALFLVIVVKYLTFIMRADNRGEGGILALLALLRPTGRAATLVTLGLFGASLLYGDGVITPAISVLSAVEGLEVAAPALAFWVVPLTVAILTGLFLVQRRGTARVGAVFGPVTLVWFVSIALAGLPWVVREPAVLAAVSPSHAVRFLVDHGFVHGSLVLGSVVLCITGGEALYADMGHFGLRPIRLAWYWIVFPALLLNYFGQGALLLATCRDVADAGAGACQLAAARPFYALVPQMLLYPMVAVATAATVVASQALISGAFSLTQQAVQLGFVPRVAIVHTSAQTEGQIFVPVVNFLLMVACISVVIVAGTSSRLAAAYGIAVTGTMAITSVLFYAVARRCWGWSRLRAGAVAGTFLAVDLAFFGANLAKLFHGGWFPMVAALGVFSVMTTWRMGARWRFREMAKIRVPFADLLASLKLNPPLRVRGTAVFMTQDKEGTPPAMLHQLKHNQVLHEQVVILTIETCNDPTVPPEERVHVVQLGRGYWRVVGRYGFMETPNVPEVLRAAASQGLATYSGRTSYFIGHETFVATGRSNLPAWRRALFMFLARNARPPTEFFGIPPNDVVELGAQIEL
jgi:KUP system potassium uptake protein